MRRRPPASSPDPYDAKLLPAGGSGDQIRVRVLNVGEREDTYELALTPAGAGTVTPRRVTVRAGGERTLTVTLQKAASLEAFSRGRGAVVADVPLTP